MGIFEIGLKTLNDETENGIEKERINQRDFIFDKLKKDFQSVQNFLAGERLSGQS